MRVSKSGLVIAAAYVALAGACIAYASTIPSAKDSSALVGVAVLPALLILVPIGLESWLANAPPLVANGLLVVVTAAVLYAACWLFGALSFRNRVVIGVGSALVLAVLFFWPVRS